MPAYFNVTKNKKMVGIILSSFDDVVAIVVSSLPTCFLPSWWNGWKDFAILFLIGYLFFVITFFHSYWLQPFPRRFLLLVPHSCQLLPHQTGPSSLH